MHFDIIDGMKRICLFVFGLMTWEMIFSQIISFEHFKQEQEFLFEVMDSTQRTTFDAYRKKLNTIYVDSLQQKWKEYILSPPVLDISKYDTIPIIPQIISSPDSLSVPALLIREEKQKPISVVPQPVAPISPPEDVPYKEISLLFYNTPVSIRIPINNHISTNITKETHVAEVWNRFSEKEYDWILIDVLELRSQLLLCDWGYVKLTQTISEYIYGISNLATIFHAYLLANSGYDIRLAFFEKNLCIGIATDLNLFEYPYLIKDDKAYFFTNKNVQKVKMADAHYGGEHLLSLKINIEPKFSENFALPRHLKSENGISTTVLVNKNHIDFYNDYPATYKRNDIINKWSVHVDVPIGQSICTNLYSTLKEVIQGKTEYDAVSVILNFVQTAFDCQTDNLIWGKERSFYPTEMFYYPYSDCEDRAILFSRLIRDLLGLNIILLYYPGHLSTAVAFTQNVEGYGVTYKDDLYIVCDPTFLGGMVGDIMPEYKNQQAKIIGLN